MHIESLFWSFLFREDEPNNNSENMAQDLYKMIDDAVKKAKILSKNWDNEFRKLQDSTQFFRLQ